MSVLVVMCYGTNGRGGVSQMGFSSFSRLLLRDRGGVCQAEGLIRLHTGPFGAGDRSLLLLDQIECMSLNFAFVVSIVAL